jgi:hypothetical protein
MLKSSLLTLGAVTAGLSCYGSYDYAMRLEGTVSYLVLASPVIAGAAAISPYYAERLWALRHRLKAMLWLLALIPTAATVFFSAAERVHLAKAAAQAEHAAAHAAASRAKLVLSEAKTKADKAEADARAQRKLSRKQCDDRCVARWDSEATQARLRANEAATAVRVAEGTALPDSPLKPYEDAFKLVLPASLDFITLIAIWSGLAVKAPAPAPAQPAKPARKRKPRVAKKGPPKLRVVPMTLH